MCYGMKCGHESYMGECMWSGGEPYPCQTQYDEQMKTLSERWQTLFSSADPKSIVGQFPHPEWGDDIVQLEDWIRWILHLHHDIGKDGGVPTNQEWKDCLAQGKKLIHDNKD